MRGDYSRLEVAREIVSDGMGGEDVGLVARVWGESDTWDDDRDEMLVLEIRIPNHEPPVALPTIRETIDHVLETMEVPAR